MHIDLFFHKYTYTLRERHSPRILRVLRRRLFRCIIDEIRRLTLQVRLEELLHRIGVPLVDGQRLAHDSIAVHHFDDRIETAHVLDLQVGEFGRPVALDERLDLRVGAKLAGAHLEHGASVFSGNRAAVFFAAAFATVVSVGLGGAVLASFM